MSTYVVVFHVTEKSFNAEVNKRLSEGYELAGSTSMQLDADGEPSFCVGMIKKNVPISWSQRYTSIQYADKHIVPLGPDEMIFN